MKRRPYYTPTELDIIITAAISLACIPVIMWLASSIGA